jgi:hydrogenase maturation protease
MSDLNQAEKTLFIGIGNYGRSDDALGWIFIDQLANWWDKYDFEYRYQLQIEDAELISKYNKVFFIDASHEQIENGFSIYECLPAPTGSFTSHQLSPETVLWLAGELFNAPPKGYVIGISGINWELNHGISNEAEKNLKNALAYFQKWKN